MPVVSTLENRLQFFPNGYQYKDKQHTTVYILQTFDRSAILLLAGRMLSLCNRCTVCLEPPSPRRGCGVGRRQTKMVTDNFHSTFVSFSADSVILFITLLPLLSFASCVAIALAWHYEETTRTHCHVSSQIQYLLYKEAFVGSTL